MFNTPFLLIAIILVALVFDFTNGAHDSGNAIATVVSTRVLSPVVAVIMAASLNLVGAILGQEVALTIGKSIVNPDAVIGCRALVLAALFGAIGWNILTWCFGLPSSSSHALIGGLCGAAMAWGGWNTVNYISVAKKVIIPLVVSPLSGFLGGYFLMVLLAWICRRVRPRPADRLFRKLQILTSALMATGHGLNDAQKTMGLITLALFTFHKLPAVEVPLWVKIVCALTMAGGTASGGWKIIKTMGQKIFKIEAIHGFAATTSTALVLSTASFFGAPISTTHVFSSSILGVGASKRFSAVRWGVAGNMIIAWVLTLPASALMGALFIFLLKLVGAA